MHLHQQYLVKGKTEPEYLQNLKEVLITLEKPGLQLKCYECEIMLLTVEYLGH